MGVRGMLIMGVSNKGVSTEGFCSLINEERFGADLEPQIAQIKQIQFI
jgi:hypothetical protein